MGLWLPIILLCSAPYSESCVVITGNELLTTKEHLLRSLWNHSGVLWDLNGDEDENIAENTN